MKKPIRFYLLLFFAFALLALDNISKWAAYTYLRGKTPIELTSTLDLRYVENRDVAFNLLQWLPPGSRKILILFIGVTMSAVILWMLYQNAQRKGPIGFSLALIFSGAIGNLIDRVFRGFVVDFLHVHLGTYSWPVFNIADICISVGVLLLGIAAFMMPDDEDEDESAPASTQSDEQEPSPTTSETNAA
ncbi:MAG: signal peptidase II [Deltaproteobacteria bacterium]|nr:signal peptidase II [Deltaproteobacteria bacterium]MBU47202.1 signal peptidase II [Deltaproteobacteria bacterium]|tara:strand:- start:1706 stop:2272 length:567 start_codon:yes stop_codon:yes gene_type:complete